MKISNLKQFQLMIQLSLFYNSINISFIKGFYMPFESGNFGII